MDKIRTSLGMCPQHNVLFERYVENQFVILCDSELNRRILNPS